MHINMRWKALWFGVFIMLLSSTSHGQAVYGSIYGTVVDNTGAAIPGANITVTDANKGTSVTAQSNASGEYSVEHLIPDPYTSLSSGRVQEVPGSESAGLRRPDR